MRKWLKFSAYVWLVDIALYFVLFYSGIAFPYISPSLKDYALTTQSVPREYMQCILWLLINYPLSFMIDDRWGGKLLILSSFQWPVIILFIAYLGHYWEEVKKKQD